MHNPVRWVDPTGLWAVCPSKVIELAKRAAPYAEKTVKWVWDGTKWVGNQAVQGGKWVGQQVGNAANWVSNFFSRGGQSIVDTLVKNASNLKRTQTVMNNAANRTYVKSTQLIQEIMQATTPMQDTQTATGLKWVVEGWYNHSFGVFELVIDPNTNTILHFLFRST